ncbi:ketoacyl-ACP synthase III [Flavobacterium sp. 3HN19-14]|uniref:ketoacyl-ACP synthase III n=1 Tax=Flavobacterium sp. 3HN19-14 TaxID=3448133 RepID=UPI003EDF1E02
MAFLKAENIHIRGIAACVPEKIAKISDLELFSEKEAQQFTTNTGIRQRRIADADTCASDLCYQAAEKILAKLQWEKSEVELLIFVSQTPDYILPATSNLLQSRLRLSKDCFCLDINLGCSGYLYGLTVVSNLMQNNGFKKGLLLVGDTISSYASAYDKSVFPLFGDAGTATALEYDADKYSKWTFITGSDGSGENAIKINAGGARNRIGEDALQYIQIDPLQAETGKRRAVDLSLNGIEVFNFAIKAAPELIKKLLEYTETAIEDIDYAFLHQANWFLNETIRKKIKMAPEKVPYSIQDFGNTNGASIPLTIVKKMEEESISESKKILMSGFGVGLSWGAALLNLEPPFATDLSIYHE